MDRVELTPTTGLLIGAPLTPVEIAAWRDEALAAARAEMAEVAAASADLCQQADELEARALGLRFTMAALGRMARDD